MNIFIVLEIIRTLDLEESHKIDIAGCYGLVTEKQRGNFETGFSLYDSFYKSYKKSLWDKYVYSINARLNGTGLTMYDYLLAGGRFAERKASSFMI